MRIETWPLNQAHAVAHLVELGARLALLEPSGLLPDLRAGLNRNDTPQMFDHLRLVLETAGFALRKGWIVTMEERTAAGRFPDITVRRNATSYVIEVTRMDASRERRAVDRYGWLVDQHRWALESRWSVDVWIKSNEVLDDSTIEDWFSRAADAAAETARDSEIRTVYAGSNELLVGPPGRRPDSLHDGPQLAYNAGLRIARRLATKAHRTQGDTPAWIRLDEDRAFFNLTELYHQTLAEQLDNLLTAVDAWLEGAEHVVGVILSDGVSIGKAQEQAAAVNRAVSGSGLILPESTHRSLQLARGPSAMIRTLPGRRSRRTFILPATGRRTVDVLGDDLQPGSWYDEEPGWLDWALTTLGWPPLTFASETNTAISKPRLQTPTQTLRLPAPVCQAGAQRRARRPIRAARVTRSQYWVRGSPSTQPTILISAASQGGTRRASTGSRPADAPPVENRARLFPCSGNA